MSENRLPDSIITLLNNAGLSNALIERSTLDTRLYHDLGLYGDTAWWLVEEMNKKMDMSNFSFERYFPPEFHGGHSFSRILNALIPFANYLHARKKIYEPLTLKMIASFIEKGRWDDQNNEAEKQGTECQNCPQQHPSPRP
jgi:hypothetical protein